MTPVEGHRIGGQRRVSGGQHKILTSLPIPVNVPVILARLLSGCYCPVTDHGKKVAGMQLGSRRDNCGVVVVVGGGAGGGGFFDDIEEDNVDDTLVLGVDDSV
ncbi:hypothetical protein HAX54_046918, partial [Datura stramonium]|nr:hypothetical protein [Datura stramonium]